MIRAAQYVLHPTKGQQHKLEHLLSQQRYLYNAALAEKRNAWAGGRRVEKLDQFAALNGLAETNPALAQYGIAAARGTLTRLDLAFQGFFRRCREAKGGEKPGYPRFKGAHRWDSVSYSDAKSWKIDPATKRLYLQGIGHIKLRLHRYLPGRPKTITVKRRGKRWVLTVFCDQVPAKPLPETGREVGIDLGVASILTTSDGAHAARAVGVDFVTWSHFEHHRERPDADVLARVAALFGGDLGELLRLREDWTEAPPIDLSRSICNGRRQP